MHLIERKGDKWTAIIKGQPDKSDGVYYVSHIKLKEFIANGDITLIDVAEFEYIKDEFKPVVMNRLETIT